MEYTALWISFHSLNIMYLTLIHVFVCISNSFFVLLSRIPLYISTMVSWSIQPNERHLSCFSVSLLIKLQIFGYRSFWQQKFLSFLSKELKWHFWVIWKYVYYYEKLLNCFPKQHTICISIIMYESSSISTSSPAVDVVRCYNFFCVCVF